MDSTVHRQAAAPAVHSPNEPAPQPPLFLVGCGRSGTTLLRLMLDSHPDIAIPGESHFIPGAWHGRRSYYREGSLDPRVMACRILDIPHVQRWALNKASVLAKIDQLHRPEFPAVIDAIYGTYAEARGKASWGDKTPIYVRNIPLLAELFPDAHFVHIIRDGRDVAMSYLSIPWGPGTIWEAARKWQRDVSAGCAAGATLGPARYLEVYYEDLIDEPRSVLKSICSFAQLHFDERMLDYHKDAPERVQSQPSMASFHGSVAQPPTRGLRDWRSEMPAAQLETFEAVAGSLLADLGYDRTVSRVRPRTQVTKLAKLAHLDACERFGAFKRVLRRLRRRVAT